ncbi:Crp/Fnr family transcriptional regulator [Aquiflexum gelatinilyticum]|uniref:Crp/Fnr family transcriptional regulator n=1 Tax=Aquiflexum gelatinilyticum TaxID=2961943 RepID=UPI002167F1A0|nr:Crp/Fnr family transcriptional regulator [Aquiflexum gelatinilyticum]MCS4433021.1 Crp/Fnr family transcriptional regulator [Aquiflexum gelatinilyticum]
MPTKSNHFSTVYSPLFYYFDTFHRVSGEAKEALAAICSLSQIPKNKDLQSIGHTCRTIYFVKKGIARIYYYKDGTDITESFAFENSLIARVESLFTGKPSKKGIQVLEDSEFIGISSPLLFDLYDQFPDIERLFRKIFESAYVETVNRIESLQFHSAEERYLALTQESPDFLKRIPLKYIASYLGITQVSLSRIRAQR